MRLLNATSLEFQDFEDESTRPKYAILSHTWGVNEVTYKQMRKDRAAARRMEGFRKIKDCAKQALKDGLGFIWVDTCCINKSSSAELSEAINSMYRWYQTADVCYTYLADTRARSQSYDYLQWMDLFKGVALVQAWLDTSGAHRASAHDILLARVEQFRD